MLLPFLGEGYSSRCWGGGGGEVVIRPVQKVLCGNSSLIEKINNYKDQTSTSSFCGFKVAVLLQHT